MPGPRNLPPRASQRRNVHQQDEPPTRTRSGRGSKSSGKFDMPPRASSNFHSNAPPLRKTTRQASNISNYAVIDSSPEVYASYEAPLFMVFGLSPEFFDTLKEHKLPRKGRQSHRAEPPPPPEPETESEDESSEESDAPAPPQPTPRGRGRGGRGSRGGRGRGRGRGRGSRGGRGRGGLARTISPVRTRPPRSAAPMSLLEESDDEDLANQSSPFEDAKESSEPEVEVALDDEQHQDGEEEAAESEAMEDVQLQSNTPPGNPPDQLVKAYSDSAMEIPVPIAIPKISLPQKASASHTPQDLASTPAESAVPKLLAPEDDVLSESDLPEPWIEGLPPPIEAECEDRADFLLKTRFKPMTDIEDITNALTKYPLSQRSTESLYALAENTQYILRAWQDEYLKLDARTAPHAHPPKKPCNGGRIPVTPQTYEDMKEADLYGYTFDPKKPPGMQDPFDQRPGNEKGGRRELRQRRTRDMLDSAAPSEDEDEDEEGRPSKRQRRATRKYDGSDQGTGANTPKKHNGWGGARKKGVSKYAQPASVTPEPDGRGKRGRAAAANLLHQRIQEMREESAMTSSGDEGSSNVNSGDASEHLAPYHKRGRPMGSKNVGRRSDYGIKKGPRKRMYEEDAPVPSAHAPNPPPSTLQSLSEGQGQFSIGPPISSTIAPSVGPHQSETVFQATPQPHDAQDAGANGQPANAHTPDTYMNTTPLSRYSNPLLEDAAATSGSSRKGKPKVKSEKRSHSMTIWWAERKARQKELEEKSGTTPTKPPSSRSNSSAGKRGGRSSAATSSSKHQDASAQPATSYRGVPLIEPYPEPEEQHQQPAPPPPHSFSAPSPTSAYAASIYASPTSMVLQPSPLTAVPAGQGPMSGPHPGGARVIAPAPMPQSVPHAYPSPYGPRSAPRPKSSGPPPLAPAPSPHISPYPPMGPMSAGRRPSYTQMPFDDEMRFKVMIPGPAPASDRRQSG